MGLKMIRGHSTDMNIDPHVLPREKRDDVGRKYFSHKTSEYYYWIMFWLMLAGFVFFFLQALSNSLFIVVSGLLFFFLIRTHFNYLKAWSDGNKYARKNVVVMDVEKQDAVIVPPKMPWISLKGTRRGL
ncbi:hypothetical protein KKG83_00150 [Candidatus Micrarchaeota archaeon]|nr:hypothetical protein [Candidatus Micrarchaeota archaeon]MBU2475863.1 hypothetical protein [Candidatus Micrarchaeota archaeon]